jgi:hypothetical protein
MNANSARLLAVLLSLTGAHIVDAGAGQSTKAAGPLRVHPENPRYFTDGTKNPDGSLRAAYLTGSHTWANLIDRGPSDPPPVFEFNGYLDLLQKHHHNFIRLWGRHVAWLSRGPGNAPDGMPKFDLTKLNQPLSALLSDLPRMAMGHTRRFAERMNLASMTPHPEPASTHYCLADPGVEYSVYQPNPGEGFPVELKTGTHRYEWFDPIKGVSASNATVNAPGGARQFKAPFEGDAVLHLNRAKTPR